ncbi:LVIVD repeat-containing protein [Aquirhabdus parva]|uniref:Uncharacterized protein n=1 Tax=Aquirhabdus parva TaxID=2283318 RepID=A0A345PAK4_9GAMM|nr:hypothetical protein [Aquirhabdus parva]AXI04313.1 hypothetical protein HYN46_16605 [Aquirhabdus parva]
MIKSPELRARLLFIVTLPLLLAACGGSSDHSSSVPDPSDSGSYSASSGVAQKGPFQQGSIVTAQELKLNMTPTGQQYSYQVTSNLGTFTPNNTFHHNLVSLNATGYYFDEVTNAISTGPVTLNGLSDLSVDTVLNVNILTSLTFQRIQTLVNQGQTFTAAKHQAETEVLAALNIPYDSSYGDFENLDLSKSSTADKMLAAISALFVTGNNAGQLSALIAQFQSEIAKNGSISTATQAKLANAAKTLNTQLVANNLTTQFASLGFAISATDLNQWIDQNGDGVIGQYRFAITAAQPATVTTMGPYIVPSSQNGATVAVTAGTLYKNGTAITTPTVKVNTNDSLSISLLSSPTAGNTLSSYLQIGSKNIAQFSVLTQQKVLTLGAMIGGVGIPNDVALSSDNNSLYIATMDSCEVTTSCAPRVENGGLYTVNVSTPTNPQSIQRIIYPTPLGNAAEFANIVFANNGSIAYATARNNGGMLLILNTTTPLLPTLISATRVEEPLGLTVSASSPVAYVSDISTQTLRRYNTSNPSAPVLTATSPAIPSQITYLSLSPDDSQLLAANQGYGDIFDMTSGAFGTSTFVSTSPSTNVNASVYIANKKAVTVTKSSINVMDYTNPQSPTVLGSVPITPLSSSEANVAAITYNATLKEAFVLSGSTVYAVNLSNPATPSISGHFTNTALANSNTLIHLGIAASSDGHTIYATGANGIVVIQSN